MNDLLRQCIVRSQNRVDFWLEFIRATEVQRMAEVGVYQGDLAATVLQHCEGVSRYYMLDPWRHLEGWNKPANQQDDVFEDYFRMAKSKTDFAKARRVILRGKTTEVIDEIPDGDLDFAYIDGDHTLKGIAIDLIRVYPKVREAGFVGGDDFTPTMWQHNTMYEPTLVFPFAVYFAEAVGATIYALPHNQFCLQKTENRQFNLVDLTGLYGEVTLRSQLAPQELLKRSVSERFPALARIVRKARNFF